ncbi:citrate synthase [Arthrobacter pigmenti]
MSDPPLPRLTTAQAAARLRVKPATLYAYVSRGLLRSERAEDGGSTFDALEIESLAGTRQARRGTAPPPPTAASGTPLMVLDSELTLVDDDGLLFRGIPAVELARKYSFERVAAWFWNPQDGLDTAVTFNATAGLAERVHSTLPALGTEAPLLDVLAMAVLAAGSSDPLRQDLSSEAVPAAGRRCISAMVDGLPDVGTGLPAEASVALRLGAKLTTVQGESPGRRVRAVPGEIQAPRFPVPANNDVERLINSALILLLDHDMAASTMAARVAASARADPYAAIGSALGAFNGVLHGSASAAAVEMLGQTMAGSGPEQSISSQLAKGRGIPGFGHRIYRTQDPRAQELFRMMQPLPAYRPVLRAVDHVTAVVHSRVSRVANIDLALAAMMIGGGLRNEAGQVIFAVARTAGWLGHILDEYTREPLRLRPLGRYTGPVPR